MSEQEKESTTSGQIIHSPVGQINVGKMLEVVITRNICGLTAVQRAKYYVAVCLALRMNPLIRPFDYIENKDGGLTLSINQLGTAQLREELGISVWIERREIVDDMYIVTAKAKTKSGRTDEASGIVAIAGLSGKHKANAMMKAETVAKKRVTVSICGLSIPEQEGRIIPAQFHDPPADVIDIDAEDVPF